jgi:hypothetical protein
MPKTPNFHKNKTIADLISDTRKPKRLADTAWYKTGEDEDYEIPFEDGWENSGGLDEEDAQWYMDDGGETRLKGIVTGGGEGSTIFTLPEENRPRGIQGFTCRVVGGGSANVVVYPNGEVVLESFN